MKRYTLAVVLVALLLGAGAIGYGVSEWSQSGNADFALVSDDEFPALPEYRWYYVTENQLDWLEDRYAQVAPCRALLEMEGWRPANEHSQPFFVETANFAPSTSRFEPAPAGYWMFSVQCELAS